MDARETCRHNIYWASCQECAEERRLRLLAMFRPLDPMEAWKNAWDDLLPTHPTGSPNQLPVFTVEDQIFLHRCCRISTK